MNNDSRNNIFLIILILYAQQLMAGLLNGFMIGIHLLGIVTGEPVVKGDLPIDEGNGKLTVNLHGWL